MWRGSVLRAHSSGHLHGHAGYLPYCKLQVVPARHQIRGKQPEQRYETPSSFSCFRPVAVAE